MRLVTLTVKLGNNESIVNGNHLVEVEIVSNVTVRLFVANKEVLT